MNRSKRTTSVYLLFQRENGVKCNLRLNLKLMSCLVCSKRSKYVRVWEKHCNGPMSYEGGRLYMNKYRTCYSIFGKDGKPTLLYRLPHCQARERIEEAIISQAPIDISELPTKNKDYRGSFFALTYDNYLIRYDVHTGEELQKVFLSNRHKFRHMSWDCEERTFYIKSTHNKMTSIARLAGVSISIVMALAIFTVFPFQFVGMLEVTKEIFGHDVTDAMISHGILIVMHQKNLVRFHNMDHILEKGSRMRVPSLDQMNDSSSPFPPGLPVNIKLEECPPVLFEVRCADHSLCLGGIPWHYIVVPPGARGTFKVYSMDNRQLADGGHLDLEELSIESDKCLFHPDDSGKILHVGSKELHVLSLLAKPETSPVLPQCEIKPHFIINPFGRPEQNNTPEITFTSSGRVVKRSHSYDNDVLDDSCEVIASVDYENDLDLLFLSVVSQGPEGPEGRVQFYCNSSGQLVKEVKLQEPWKEFCDHFISVDLDMMVHIVKHGRRKSCYVYHLQRDQSDDESEDSTRDRCSDKDGVKSESQSVSSPSRQLRQNHSTHTPAQDRFGWG